jgi:hypothetical protein
MAKAIFNLNSENEMHSLYRIARDEDFLNANKNFDSSSYTIFDITTEQFEGIKNQELEVISHDGSTITFENIVSTEPAAPAGNTTEPKFKTEAELKNYIQEQIEQLENYTKYNSGKPIISIINSYVSWLKALDTSSLAPLDISLEKYATQQGQESLSILELI